MLKRIKVENSATLFVSRNFGVKCKKCGGNRPRARHNFSQIYANSLADVGQPIERLSPRLICRATSPIYAKTGARSKLAEVCLRRGDLPAPRGWKRSRNVCRAPGQDDPLALTSSFNPPATPASLLARKYDIWQARCMDNLISLSHLR